MLTILVMFSFLNGASNAAAPVVTNTQHVSRTARKPNQPLGFE